MDRPRDSEILTVGDVEIMSWTDPETHRSWHWGMWRSCHGQTQRLRDPDSGGCGDHVMDRPRDSEILTVRGCGDHVMDRPRDSEILTVRDVEIMSWTDPETQRSWQWGMWGSCHGQTQRLRDPDSEGMWGSYHGQTQRLRDPDSGGCGDHVMDRPRDSEILTQWGDVGIISWTDPETQRSWQWGMWGSCHGQTQRLRDPDSGGCGDHVMDRPRDSEILTVRDVEIMSWTDPETQRSWQWGMWRSYHGQTQRLRDPDSEGCGDHVMDRPRDSEILTVRDVGIMSWTDPETQRSWQWGMWGSCHGQTQRLRDPDSEGCGDHVMDRPRDSEILTMKDVGIMSWTDPETQRSWQWRMWGSCYGQTQRLRDPDNEGCGDHVMDRPRDSEILTMRDVEIMSWTDPETQRSWQWGMWRSCYGQTQRLRRSWHWGMWRSYHGQTQRLRDPDIEGCGDHVMDRPRDSGDPDIEGCGDHIMDRPRDSDQRSWQWRDVGIISWTDPETQRSWHWGMWRSCYGQTQRLRDPDSEGMWGSCYGQTQRLRDPDSGGMWGSYHGQTQRLRDPDSGGCGDHVMDRPRDSEILIVGDVGIMSWTDPETQRSWQWGMWGSCHGQTHRLRDPDSEGCGDHIMDRPRDSEILTVRDVGIMSWTDPETQRSWQWGMWGSCHGQTQRLRDPDSGGCGGCGDHVMDRPRDSEILTVGDVGIMSWTDPETQRSWQWGMWRSCHGQTQRLRDPDSEGCGDHVMDRPRDSEILTVRDVGIMSWTDPETQRSWQWGMWGSCYGQTQRLRDPDSEGCGDHVMDRPRDSEILTVGDVEIISWTDPETQRSWQWGMWRSCHGQTQRLRDPDNEGCGDHVMDRPRDSEILTVRDVGIISWTDPETQRSWQWGMWRSYHGQTQRLRDPQLPTYFYM